MRASRAPLIVLTGGPGCGKTFATKAIVQLWDSQKKDIRLAAPTGSPSTHPVADINPFQMFLQFLLQACPRFCSGQAFFRYCLRKPSTITC